MFLLRRHLLPTIENQMYRLRLWTKKRSVFFWTRARKIRVDSDRVSLDTGSYNMKYVFFS